MEAEFLALVRGLRPGTQDLASFQNTVAEEWAAQEGNSEKEVKRLKARLEEQKRRKRKLLMHRREIDRLAGKIREKGYTLVPLSLYEKKGRVKAELALVHGKQEWDKREDSKKRESQREIDRAMASRRR